MLGFVEEMVLLQLDETQGGFAELPQAAADIVLAGAAMMELALQNRVDADLERLFVVDGGPTGDAMLDDALALLGEAGAPTTPPRRSSASPPTLTTIAGKRCAGSSRRACCAKKTAGISGSFGRGATRSSTTASSARSGRDCASWC